MDAQLAPAACRGWPGCRNVRPMSVGDVAAAYQAYLARFERTLGECEIGSFAKHEGKLVKKLAAQQFAAVWDEYHHVTGAYFDSIKRGDTINDVLVKLIRDRAAQLVLPSPV